MTKEERKSREYECRSKLKKLLSVSLKYFTVNDLQYLLDPYSYDYDGLSDANLDRIEEIYEKYTDFIQNERYDRMGDDL